MAEKWGNHEQALKKLEADLKPYSAKLVGACGDAAGKAFKKCLELEEKLGHMAVKARQNGLTGTDVTDFKRDSGFYDAYKALDREIDVLAKAMQETFVGSNHARAGLNDIKTLTEHIEADLKKHEKELDEARDDLKKEQAKAKTGKGVISPATVKLVDALEKEFKKREPDLKKLLSEMDKLKKDLTEAGNVYRKEVDQRMESYVQKDFKKLVQKLIGIVPGDNAHKEGLPTALQPRVLDVAVKKAVNQGKSILKHLKAAVDKAESGGPEAAGAELKAAKVQLDLLKKAHKQLAANRKKYASHIKKANDSKELYRLFKQADEVFADSEKSLVETVKKIMGAK